MDYSDEYDSEEIVVASANVSTTRFDGSDPFARSAKDNSSNSNPKPMTVRPRLVQASM